MKPIKGENLMFFVKEDDLLGNGSSAMIPLALATSCNLNVSVEAFDTTSKDSGSWKESAPGMKSWDGSSDNLYCPHIDKLFQLMLNRTTIEVWWSPSNNSESGNVVSHTPSLSVDGETYQFYKGNAWINNITANAPNNESANYTVSFTGTGPLSPDSKFPTQGIGVDNAHLTAVAGDVLTVHVQNATGTITATSSSAGNVAASVGAYGVVTLTVDDSATAGMYIITIADSGTSTSCYVTVLVTAS